MKTFSLDTESTYEKGRDIRSLGVQQYLRHPETQHYMVSAWDGETGGAMTPLMFHWRKLKGATVLSHNAAYDQSVVAELQRRGLAEKYWPKEWNCTADMASYLQAPRNLADAAEVLLGRKVDKKIRDDMKGRRWSELSQDEMVAVAKYCLDDAKTCYELWQKFSDQWPEHERALSRHTQMMCRRGIAVDRDKIQLGIMRLTQEKWRVQQSIPWAGEVNAKGEELAVTSPKQLGEECRRRGIEPPTSTDAKSQEFAMWLEAHREKADFVLAVQHWRQTNRLLQVLQTMEQRQVDGILYYGLKYFGAIHTGRWSGDAGLNLQNLPRKPFAGVDARACLVPRPGKVFICGDLSQIEARVTCWLAEDEETLALLRQGVDLYEAHARRTMGYQDPRPLEDVDPDLRQFAKCRVLALGFGLGSGKFKAIVKLWTGKEIDEDQAGEMVKNFRETNPRIRALWSYLEETAKQSLERRLFEMRLASERVINYFDVCQGRRGILARVQRGGLLKNIYGGLLTENAVQATARDLFAEAILRVERAGLPVVLHIHDEVVVEVAEDEAKDAAKVVKELLRQPPEWAQDLPVACKVEIRKEYGK